MNRPGMRGWMRDRGCASAGWALDAVGDDFRETLKRFNRGRGMVERRDLRVDGILFVEAPNKVFNGFDDLRGKTKVSTIA